MIKKPHIKEKTAVAAIIILGAAVFIYIRIQFL